MRAFTLPVFGLFAMLAALATSAVAAEPFTDRRFEELTGAGKIVVLNVHAEWCPTCRRQQPVLLKLVSAPPYQDFSVLVVDYDNQGDVRKHFKVAQQSTLVVFKGPKETGRATGVTEPEQISAVLDSARK